MCTAGCRFLRVVCQCTSMHFGCCTAVTQSLYTCHKFHSLLLVNVKSQKVLTRSQTVHATCLIQHAEPGSIHVGSSKDLRHSHEYKTYTSHQKQAWHCSSALTILSTPPAYLSLFIQQGALRNQNTPPSAASLCEAYKAALQLSCDPASRESFVKG